MLLLINIGVAKQSSVLFTVPPGLVGVRFTPGSPCCCAMTAVLLQDNVACERACMRHLCIILNYASVRRCQSFACSRPMQPNPPNPSLDAKTSLMR